MGKKKIVIDTNNFISAVGWEGNSRELLLQVIAGKYELFISIKQLEEVKRVLEYPKFKFTAQQKQTFLQLLTEIATVVNPSSQVTVITEDPDDNMLLECAVKVNADFLITGDMHLRRLKAFNCTQIVTVHDFLNQNSKN